jgi:hypothetical protein
MYIADGPSHGHPDVTARMRTAADMTLPRCTQTPVSAQATGQVHCDRFLIRLPGHTVANGITVS